MATSRRGFLLSGTSSGNGVKPDSFMSDVSENPVQNKVIKKYIDTSDRRVVGEERLLGEWTEDGITYDVLQKTVKIGALPNASSVVVRHEIENLVRFTRIYGTATSSTNNLALPFAALNPQNNIYVGVGKSNITIETGSDRRGFTAWVTLEFIRRRS